MVAFATSTWHAKEAALPQSSFSGALVQSHPSTQLSVHASVSVNHGINHLLTLQNGASSRRRFSNSQATSTTSTPAASPRPISPAPLPDPNVPPMPNEDPAVLEATKVQKDCAIAKEQLDAYLCALCESYSISAGTLVQYWNVSILQYFLDYYHFVDSLKAQWKEASASFSCCPWYSPCSSICCAMQTYLFLQQAVMWRPSKLCYHGTLWSLAIPEAHIEEKPPWLHQTLFCCKGGRLYNWGSSYW